MAMEKEVLEFTAQYFGVNSESLSLRTRPYPDLCLDDTRMEAFLWRFSQHFGVSFPKLNNRHAWAYIVQSLPLIPEIGALFWVPTALWLWPVSYTHLDVYKRQPSPGVWRTTRVTSTGSAAASSTS